VRGCNAIAHGRTFHDCGHLLLGSCFRGTADRKTHHTHLETSAVSTARCILSRVFFRESERRRAAVWEAVTNKDIEALRAGIGIWTGPNIAGLMNQQSILNWSIQQGFTEGAKIPLEKASRPQWIGRRPRPYHPHVTTHNKNDEELHKDLKTASAHPCARNSKRFGCATAMAEASVATGLPITRQNGAIASHQRNTRNSVRRGSALRL
jgi:hypothetical protein